MSQSQTSSTVASTPTVEYVSITGRLIPISSEDHMKLARLAWSFRRAVQVATRMIARGMDNNEILRELRKMLNKGYADSAFKIAKAIVKGCIATGGDPLHVEVRKLFIVSEGESSRLGNRNVRFMDTSMVKVKYPYDGSWIQLRAKFGEEYLPLLNELIGLANQKKASYTAKIVFRDGEVYLHVSVPIELYLKHFRNGNANGRLIAGFDLNSDRVNMVILDELGVIRDAKTEWFPEATSPGFPRSKATALRLRALAKLLEYAYHHGVGVVVLEDLERIKKRRRYTKSKSANRKITRFPKRKLLEHAIVMAMKYGFEVLLVDPKGTTSSSEHDEAMKKYGVDKHTASAYLVALRALHQIKQTK